MADNLTNELIDLCRLNLMDENFHENIIADDGETVDLGHELANYQLAIKNKKLQLTRKIKYMLASKQITGD